MSADTRDHVPPLSSADPDGPFPLLVYPACRECNTLLGDRYLFTLGEREDYIRDALRKRYARALKQVPFDEDELAELGPSLRKEIQHHLLVASQVRERIAHSQPKE